MEPLQFPTKFRSHSLFREPGEDAPFGWIADGWLIDMEDGSRRSFGTDGLVETEYELPSAIVFEIRSTGWIRFRYLADENTTAWTHECFFDLADDPVSVTTWEERLTSDLISPLFFRREVPHALRAQPLAEFHSSEPSTGRTSPCTLVLRSS